MTTATQPSRARLRVLVLAALTALATLLFGAGTASAAAVPAAQTRVGVSHPTVVHVVGVAQHIAAGQHWVRGPSPLRLVVGHCVAAKSSTSLLDDAGRTESHLARLDHSPANDAMPARIRGAAAGGRPLTEADQNFMTHELTEAGLMDRGMGYPGAHELAGQTHSTFANYHPDVIKQFPELFNQNWRNYWEIE